MPQLYVDLALPIAVDRLFTYSVPKELEDAVRPGIRVIAPFGRRTTVGLIVDVHRTRPGIHTIKQIGEVMDAQPIVMDELLSLTRWISQYYFASLGEVLKTAIAPEGFRPFARRVRLIPSVMQQRVESFSQGSLLIIDALRDYEQRTVKQLQRKTGIRQIHSLLNALAKDGIISFQEEQQGGIRPKVQLFVEMTDELRRRSRQWLTSSPTDSRYTRRRRALAFLLESPEPAVLASSVLAKTGLPLSTLRSLERNQLISLRKKEVLRGAEGESPVPGTGRLILNERQRHAVDAITAGVRAGSFSAYLLYGVTGSGKTQVYIESIRTALEAGKTAMVLVPEISLTPQIVDRFRMNFGKAVTVWHSKLSRGERGDAWRLLQEGKSPIVIGPRSAVFSPLKNLGLIIVDEEHEASYKQFDRTPRYHARDVAIMRAHFANAAVVLGSATPSLESYTNALNGKYSLLELPERVDNARLPSIEVVDMGKARERKFAAFREERKAEFKLDPAAARASRRRFEHGMISDKLAELIALRLERKEGIILLQNRRGYAPLVECPRCGYVELCPNCNITLTYHLTQKHLRCHYCGRVSQPPEVCPKCEHADMRFRGFGTQRVEAELRNLFPEARLARMDLDTTTRKRAHEEILGSFSRGETDILLGTQMVGKGLDFPRVTLVGVISADTQMLLPDFRSAERTFQLLTQVSGRAGRSALSGEVIIQTFQPEHYSLRHVLRHDFRSFYTEELQYRQELSYPPFSRIVLIECTGNDEGAVSEHITFLANLLKKNRKHYIVLGPSPAAIPRINKKFRWHIVLKHPKSNDPSGSQLHRRIGEALSTYSSSPLGRNKEVRCIIDVDPVGMM